MENTIEQKFEIEKIIMKLAERRKLFHSEDDFKFALALTIKELYKNAEIRLEYPFDNIHIDILVNLNDNRIPIELKYKTKEYHLKVNEENYNLKEQYAENIGKYLYLKDIQRIENLIGKCSKISEGYTIFVTNNKSYQNSSRSNSKCINFSLKNGRIIKKKSKLVWNKSKVKKYLENPIELKNEYQINWKQYSKIDDSNAGTFIYLVNRIV